MDGTIQTFNSPDFGVLTTIIIDDNPWFIGKEVSNLLGYENSRDTIRKHVDVEDKVIFNKSFLTSQNATLENIPNRGLTCINESGLYSLILSSKLPSAKKFKHWVTSEVLPSIRKHGTYMTPETIEQVLFNPDTIIKIATQLKEEREKNKYLSATNTALTKEANTWDNKSIINALIRAYASYHCQGKFQTAWNIFYKRLNYKLHINLKRRMTVNEIKYKSLIDYISEVELKDAVKIAAAMCEEVNIPTGKIINETNLALIV